MNSSSNVRLDESYSNNPTPQFDSQDNISLSHNKLLYQFKIILLGDIAVGKTSLLRRFVENDFLKDYHCTIGVEFRIKTIEVSESISTDLKIWDTCGEEKYRVITRQYYREAQGVILVFDLTQYDTFQRLGDWLNDIRMYGPENVSVLLIGNKSDLVNDREVSEGDIERFCEKYKGLGYIETSAYDGRNVNDLFKSLAMTIVDKERECKDRGMSSYTNTFHQSLSNGLLSKKMQEMKPVKGQCC